MSKEHAFWNTQPVPQSADPQPEGPLEPVQDPKPESYTLPAPFEWCELQLQNLQSPDLNSLYTLLSNNYVEHSSAEFRFDYSKEFLLWALASPGSTSTLHLGVKCEGKLVAFISAIPVHIQTPEGNKLHVSEVNFLCIHKSLRSRRLAPVMIREITRKSHFLGIRQGIYTAGVRLPEPFAVATYFHRPLNAAKVLATGFCNELPPEEIPLFLQMFEREEEGRAVRALLAKANIHYRKASLQDMSQMYALFQVFMQQFALKPLFTMEEFEHWLLPRDGVISNWVFLEGGKMLGFYSVYAIPSSVLDSESGAVVASLQNAYSFYYALSQEYNCALSLKHMIEIVAHEGKKEGFDLFNSLNVMNSTPEVLEDCLFAVGDGRLHHYMFNWGMRPVSPNEIGFLFF